MDRALSALRTAPEAATLPKGLSARDAGGGDAARCAVREQDGLTASAAAEQLGVNRITARRYLEHLVESESAARAPQYGHVGRPELCYRWRG